MKKILKMFFTVPSVIAAVLYSVWVLGKNDMAKASEWFLLLLVDVIILLVVSYIYNTWKKVKRSAKNEHKDRKIMMEGAEERIRKNHQAGVACCPNCGSTSLSANAELLNAKKVTVTCLSCGHHFKNKRH